MTWVRSGVAATVLFGTLAAAGCAREETLLAVHASAATRTAPDLAIVTLGVLARGASAAAAQQAQNDKMSAVVAEAQAAGAAEGDIQTVGFSLEPQFVYARGQAPRINAYLSRNSVSIRIRDLNAVSGLIDATVAQGANELQGVRFTFQDEEASREAARAQALQTARRRAERYAEAADMQVAGIRSIIEPGSALPQARRGDGYALGAVAVEQAANATASINPGRLDNEASVTVVFALR